MILIMFFFQIVIPFEKSVSEQHHADERPSGLQLLISQAVVSNCRVGAKCAQADVLDDLQSFISQRQYADMSCYPNEKTDFSPYPNATWLNDYSINCHQLQNLTKRDKDLYNRLKRDKNLPHQIWCIWCDQLWMEFIGVEKANGRPITFVDAFPVRVWLCQEVPYTFVEEERPISPLSTGSSIETCESVSENDDTLSISSRKRGSIGSTHSEIPTDRTLLQVASTPLTANLRNSHSDSELVPHPQHNTNLHLAASSTGLAVDSYAWGGPPPPYGGITSNQSVNSLPPAYEVVAEEDPGPISKHPLEECTNLDLPPGVNQMTASMALLVNVEKTVQVQLDHFQLLSLLRIAESVTSMLDRIELDNKQQYNEEITNTELVEEQSMVLNIRVPHVVVDLILAPCIGIDPIQRLSLKERVEYEKERKDKSISADLPVSGDAYILPMRSRGRTTVGSSPMSASLSSTPNLSEDRKTSIEVVNEPNLQRNLSLSSFGETVSQASSDLYKEGSFKEVKDAQIQAGDPLVNANLKPPAESQLISVLRVRADGANLGIQSKGETSIVKVSADLLNLNELGNMKYGHVLDPRGCIVEEAEKEKHTVNMNNLTGDAMLKLRLITGPKAELYAKDGKELGFADIRVDSLAAALLMSTVDNLTEFAEDEFVLPTMPFKVKLNRSDISLYDDKPRKSRAAIKLPPSHIIINELLVERDSSGVIILNQKSPQSHVRENDQTNLAHPNEHTASYNSSVNSTLIAESIHQQVEALIGENGRLVEDLKVVNARVTGLHSERESLLKVIDKLQQELVLSNKENDDLQKRVHSLSIKR